MKNIIILLSIIFLTITSCTNKEDSKNYDEYGTIVNDEVNKYNYTIIKNLNGEDTIQLVSIDTVIKVGNVPQFSKMVGKDTTTINITNRLTAVVIGCKVRVFKSGYYKVTDMTITYYEDKPNSLLTLVSNEYSDYTYVDAINNLKRSDNVLLSSHRKTMLELSNIK